MTDEELDIDKIIAANMTVTDHLLRDAIRGVVIDAMNKAAEREREACAKLCEDSLYCAAVIRSSDNKGIKWEVEP
jgi:hypothetical protein